MSLLPSVRCTSLQSVALQIAYSKSGFSLWLSEQRFLTLTFGDQNVRPVLPTLLNTLASTPIARPSAAKRDELKELAEVIAAGNEVAHFDLEKIPFGLKQDSRREITGRLADAREPEPATATQQASIWAARALEVMINAMNSALSNCTLNICATATAT